MKIADHFKAMLAQFDLGRFDASDDIIYGVDEDMRLAYINDRWTTVAVENDAGDTFLDSWGIGAPVDAAIGDELAPFYLDKFERTRRTGEPWEHVYLCADPKAVSKYRMRILPLSPNGWLITHTKLVEMPHQDLEPNAPVDAFVDENGLYHQCSHCSRFLKAGTQDQWNWVPTLFANPPERTSHGLCETCYAYYYTDGS